MDTYFKIAGVIHLGAEGCEVAGGAEAGQPVALHANGSLGEVEDAGVGQLSDVATTEEGEFDGKAIEQSELGRVRGNIDQYFLHTTDSILLANYWHTICILYMSTHYSHYISSPTSSATVAKGKWPCCLADCSERPRATARSANVSLELRFTLKPTSTGAKTKQWQQYTLGGGGETVITY